jgi:prophage antirepressor-like protein
MSKALSPANSETPERIALFNGVQIRKVMHEGEWYFVVQDVVGALTSSVDPK